MFFGRTTHPLSRLRTVCDRWEFVSHVPSIRMLTTRQLILPTSPPVLSRSSLTNRSYQSIANFARCYATAKSKPIRADDSKTDDTESPETDKLNASRDTTKSDLMETVRKNSRGKLYNPVDLATSMDYVNSTGHLSTHSSIIELLLVEIEKARDVGTIEMWLPFYLYDYRDYYTDLEPDQLEALLKASGYMPPANNGSIYEPTVNPSTTRLNELPPAVQDILLRSSGTIPHAREYVASEAKTDWSRPRVPNRTSASVGHGPLRFVMPQTRLRVVDNSPWSSIAPTASTAAPSSGKKRQPAGSQKPGLAVQSILAAGTAALAPKPALCIRVYNHQNKGRIGDKVIVAVGGQKKRGWIVGTRQASRDGWPRFESNNIVLVDDEGNPLGTRILVPIPAKLRSLSGDISKILSIATQFV
ncbi:39S ribosomal protein L14 mitochondrial [Fasciola gigantica]|uniref:Large ribosomal subunit protein uL14m n=1 Tax=Fasciola gigantica TaxID=46835 RepID=A0A504YGG2_FASGI|nr:39S ribosomal protein L14 mitochondrial [Fasciola gigantica]